MNRKLFPPDSMSRIINSKRYSVATATLLASNSYWDGSNFTRNGRNTFLYKTPQGAYFKVNMTMWQGEQDVILPLTQKEARELYEEDLTEHDVAYEDAFPGVKVEEA